MAVPNVGMVGQLGINDKTREERVSVEALGAAKEVPDQAEASDKQYGALIKPPKSMQPYSDHASFYRAKVPTPCVWTGFPGWTRRPRRT